MRPGVTPMTGDISIGGASGNIQARQAVFPGIIEVTCPSNPLIAPWNKGIPNVQAR